MADLQDIQIEDLPPKLAEIAERIGLVQALELAVTWPGVRLFVPKQIDESHPIAVQIGLRAAQQLAEFYGGAEIVPPRSVFARAERSRIQAQVVAEFRAGAGAATLAQKYDVHEVTIYRWAKKANQGTANTC